MFTKIINFILAVCGGLFVVLVFLYALGGTAESKTPELKVHVEERSK